MTSVLQEISYDTNILKTRGLQKLSKVKVEDRYRVRTGSNI